MELQQFHQKISDLLHILKIELLCLEVLRRQEANRGDSVLPKGNSRGHPQEFVVIIIVRLRHYQVKIIDVFGKLVALEAEVTEKDVPKLSLDDDTRDELQMKALCYMLKLVERLDCICVFCRVSG